MLSNQNALVPEDAPEITLSHHYAADRAMVWEVWTDPKHLVHWWGPDGFTIEHIGSDTRTGGYWEFIMVAPDGTRFHNYHQYTNISPKDLITHRHGTKKDDPDAFDARITFEDKNGGTLVTMNMRFPNMAARQDALGYDADKLGLQTMRKAEDYMKGGTNAE